MQKIFSFSCFRVGRVLNTHRKLQCARLHAHAPARAETHSFRRQEGLDGETIARLAAVHGTRPNPAGPAGTVRMTQTRSAFGRSFNTDFSNSFRRRSLPYLAATEAPCQNDGISGGLSTVTDALAEWWHSDPAQRPAAGTAAEKLEEAAAAAAATAEAAAAGVRRRRQSHASLLKSLSLAAGSFRLAQPESQLRCNADSPLAQPVSPDRDSDARGDLKAGGPTGAPAVPTPGGRSGDTPGGKWAAGCLCWLWAQKIVPHAAGPAGHKVV